MRKRIFCFFFVIYLLLFSNITIFASNGYNSKEYNVSYFDDINYFNAIISNNSIEMVIENVRNKNDCFVKINDKKRFCNLGDDGRFYISFPLNEISGDVCTINVYQGDKGDELYWSFLKRDIKMINLNGEWSFYKETNYENNKIISDDKNLDCYTILPVSSLVKEYSDNIVKGANTNEEKVAKIYKWIIENIAYDYDNMSINGGSYNIPDFVLKEKKAVCYGISLTAQALCHAQNIPCLVYVGKSKDGVTNNYGPHAWNEIFVFNEWFVFDFTSDVYYGVKDGQRYEKNHNNGVYYNSFMDINNASKNLIYERLDNIQLDIIGYFSKIQCSDWAKDDILNSLYSEILTQEFIGDISRPITRAEFCRLLYLYIWYQFYETNSFGYSREEITSIIYKGLDKYYYPFKDNDEIEIYKWSIYVCYDAGIVNGKTPTYFCPNDYITREEAAVMLSRTLDYFGKFEGNFNRSYNTEIKYADDINISDWAKKSVSIVSDMGIMKGQENNNFNPKGTYTIEQTLATLYRLFKYNYKR